MERPWRDFQADLACYREEGVVKPLLLRQGLWALAQYRFARWLRLSPGRRWLKPVEVLWRKLVEILTGISISGDAQIGPGLEIGHFGGIVVGPGVALGAECAIAQGVTIGTGTGRRRGSPRIGSGTYIAAGAKVFGPIVVGDHVAIGANAVVFRDVPDGALAVGVPATVRQQP